MKQLFILLLFLLFTVNCLAQKFSVEEKKEILKVLEDQRIAWNNGDLSAYMQGYWQSDSLRFITKNGITFGWKETLERYRKVYPTKEAMGNLTFEVISLEELKLNSAFMIGKWTLEIKDKIVSGSFSLIWQKINRKWLIVVDHSS